MKTIFQRITLDPEVMGGKPCIRGIRMTVGTILGLQSGCYPEPRVVPKGTCFAGRFQCSTR